MAPEVVAAFVTAGGAIALGLWNAWRVAGLERYKSALVREEATARAKLDYEYEARRRLYERFEPPLFQLLELADYALERIANLTDPKVWEEFEPAEDEPPQKLRRPRMVKPNYAAVSTLYGLFAPLVIVRSMSRELTLVDLSLELRIELQYFLASRLYGSFKDDFKLAAIEPRLTYDPLNSDWRRLRQHHPAVYWLQGLTMGRLEGILDLMTIEAGSDRTDRLASFGEFERRWEDIVDSGDERERKSLAVASNALLGFRPDHRPVFWRVLIAQARLHQALLRTRSEGFSLPKTAEDWAWLMALEDREQFEWKAVSRDAPSLEQTCAATDVYLWRLVEQAHLSLRTRQP